MSGTGRPASSFSTSRPVAISMVFLAAVVFGVLSYQRLPVQLMPDLTYPTLTVRTEYEGAAPEEVENDVTRPIEEAVGVVGGLRRLSSISRAGLSDVVLEFAWDTDMGDAAQDVLEKLDLVELPETATRPLILRFDPNLDPIMELSLSGESELYPGAEGLRRLRRIAELEVRRALEPIKGVAAARIKGGLEEEVHVLLDEDKLQRARLSILDVIDRLRQENINVAGGTLREGRTEYMVRTLNEYRDLGEIADTIVARFDGRDVRVRDLGKVVRSNADREIATRTNGQPSVLIEIYKEGDANIVSVARRVRELVEGTAGAASAPRPGRNEPVSYAEQLRRGEGVELAIVGDRSQFIESSIREVRDTAIWGGLLAIGVLFVFLRRVRPTAIIAASIPISILITFAPLHLAGVSLNVMSLGGLALGVGMLVDSSIVVLESIQRCREEGDRLIAATIRGTREVRAAVIASTLTSIAVFLPMVFVEGVAGQAFGDLGLAVTFSLLAAMLVALALIPMLASRAPLRREEGIAGGPLRPTASSLRWLRDRVRTARLWQWVTLVLPLWWLARTAVALVLELAGWLVSLLLAVLLLAARLVATAAGALLRVAGAASEAVAGRALAALGRGYPRALRAALAHPWLVLVSVVVISWLTVVLARGLDSELLPEVHQGEFTVEMMLPVGTPLDETDRMVRPVEQAILADTSGAIRALLVTVGFDRENSQRADEGENTARFTVLLDPARRGAATEDRLIEGIRRRLADVPDLEARIARPVLFSQRTPIEVEIEGDDLAALRRQTERVRERLAGLGELSDVEATQRRGAPEVQVIYDRERLTRLGLDIGQVARIVRDKVQGFEATRLNRRDRRIPIVVRLDQSDRETVEDVRKLVINPSGERPVRLEAVAAVRLGEGPSEVRRVDGQRVALVRANVAGGSLGSAVDAIRHELTATPWPTTMGWVLAGQSEEWERSRSSLLLALALSVFFVYVIMAFQFESLAHPLVIMLTIPLAFVGTVLALRLLDIPLSVVVFLGMIMLAGIVVNNAIVLVDYINTLRSRGLDRQQAIVEAGRVRLRPILMTTATTVLGLLPLALGFGDGAELRSPMAIAVISGLITSTLLTLLVVPTVYAVLEDTLDWVLGRRRRRGAAPDPGAGEVAR